MPFTFAHPLYAAPIKRINPAWFFILSSRNHSSCTCQSRFITRLNPLIGSGSRNQSPNGWFSCVQSWLDFSHIFLSIHLRMRTVILSRSCSFCVLEWVVYPCINGCSTACLSWVWCFRWCCAGKGDGFPLISDNHGMDPSPKNRKPPTGYSPWELRWWSSV